MDNAPLDHEVEHESPEHPSQFEPYDNLNVSLILVVGIISAVLTFISIAAAHAVYSHYAKIGAYEKQVLAPTVVEDNTLYEQRHKLEAYGGVSAAERQGLTPIHEAMRAVVAELNVEQSQPSGRAQEDENAL